MARPQVSVHKMETMEMVAVITLVMMAVTAVIYILMMAMIMLVNLGGEEGLTTSDSVHNDDGKVDTLLAMMDTLTKRGKLHNFGQELHFEWTTTSCLSSLDQGSGSQTQAPGGKMSTGLLGEKKTQAIFGKKALPPGKKIWQSKAGWMLRKCFLTFLSIQKKGGFPFEFILLNISLLVAHV